MAEVSVFHQETRILSCIFSLNTKSSKPLMERNSSGLLLIKALLVMSLESRRVEKCVRNYITCLPQPK